MNLLVDSHVLIWWLDDDPRLAAVTRSLIESADNVFVSVMSIWELGIKSAAGKIEIDVDLADEAQVSGFDILDCTVIHAKLAPTLPLHHKDPFDRMLIAQAMTERLSIVSQDAAFSLYDVDLIAAQ